MDFSSRIQHLFASQLADWPLARQNYTGLRSVLVKTISIGNFEIKVQFNPERMVSSAAKVDAASIEARPCFLCRSNLPAEQKSLLWGDDYQILVNPFPIFPQHLTITANSHVPQSLEGRFGDMLDLASALHRFTVFYNGPQCGASAPDHFHFQAGSKGFLPIEGEFGKPHLAQCVYRGEGLRIFRWPAYLRGTVTLAGSNKKALEDAFSQLYNELYNVQADQLEPKLNILALWERGEWVVHVFPRKRHRPDRFFMTGADSVVISPASVDMGGVWVTPRKEDFDKLDEALVTEIVAQLCFSDAQLDELFKSIW